jgi:hypothetical protein
MSYFGNVRIETNVNYNGYDVGVWALGVCGLTSVERGSAYSKPNKTVEKELNLDGVMAAHAEVETLHSEHGNIIFAITSSQLKQSPPIYKNLLEHPHCRIVHAYKNNAHGPNVIFICVLHKYPDQVHLPEHKNNIEEYKERLYREDYEYYLKEKECIF